MNTTLIVHGERLAYPPIARELPANALTSLGRPLLEEACGAPSSADGLWAQVRSRLHAGRTLRVGIIGCSTTAGCGALAPSSQACSVPRSWGRHAHDQLLASVQPHGYKMETSIFHKNAVEATFFLDCMHQLLPPMADVVILEVLQNMYALSTAALLNLTVAAVRRTAPGAAILLIGWLKYHLVKPSVLSELQQLSSALAVDFVNVPAAMRLMSTSQPAMSARKHGRMDHHPSGQGHELIGELAARCINRRVRPSRMPRNGTGAPKRSGVGSNGHPCITGPTCRPDGRWGGNEICYNSALELPVMMPKIARSTRSAFDRAGGSGFALVDDGGDKGIKKLGYASTRIGDILMLGPVQIPAPQISALSAAPFRRQCYVNLRVRFGYFVSSHAGQGVLTLLCTSGCLCRPMKSVFLRSSLPFPRLETDARRLGEFKLDPSENVSMTAYTSFIVMLDNTTGKATTNRSRGCHVHAQHSAPHGHQKGSKSRVRVDSLAVMPHGTRATIPC